MAKKLTLTIGLTEDRKSRVTLWENWGESKKAETFVSPGGTLTGALAMAKCYAMENGLEIENFVGPFKSNGEVME